MTQKCVEYLFFNVDEMRKDYVRLTQLPSSSFVGMGHCFHRNVAVTCFSMKIGQFTRSDLIWGFFQLNIFHLENVQLQNAIIFPR